MLRSSELGCREGWGVDYWAPSNAPVTSPAGASVTPERIVALSAPAVTPTRTEIVAGTTRPDTTPVAHPGSTTPVVAPVEEDIFIRHDASGTQHPELNDQGVPLPRARRSSVGEAHRRAIERRQNERQTLEQRRAVPETAGRQTFQGAGAANGRTGEKPGTTGAVAPPVVPPTTPTRGEHESTLARLPAAIGATPAGRAVTPTPIDVENRQTNRATPAPLPRPVAARQDAAGSGESRYWDEPTSGSRFVRMRPASGAQSEVPRGGTPPEVQQVGRGRPGPARPDTSGRTIRSLDRSSEKFNVPLAAEETRYTPNGAPEKLAELPVHAPRRQADPVAVRQLAAEWREQVVQAHAGQQCGTCRYFRGGDGQEGQCEASGAPTYRQVVSSRDLACLSSLGAWWVASDAGWLEKTHMPRPGRATPLLDALERDFDIREPMVAERQARGR